MADTKKGRTFKIPPMQMVVTLDVLRNSYSKQYAVFFITL